MMLISVVIPTYNEEADIARTLDAVLSQTWSNKEIIVVDDSTDRTPEIVRSYASRGVRLVQRESPRNGCCGARNAGMREARGDVVVLLNGDVVLGQDFLARLAPYYDDGADFVVVESRVLNQGSVYARWVGAASAAHYAENEWPIYWSEGFSCRRSAALSAGLIPGDYPIAFCRDWLFGMRLLEAGFNRYFVPELIAEHVAPDAFDEYWKVRKARGRISVLFKFFIDGVPLPLLPVRLALKNIKALFGILLVVPLFARAARASRHSPRGGRDTFGFWIVGAVEQVAIIFGGWSGFASICRQLVARKVSASQAIGSWSQWRNWLGERHAVRHATNDGKA